MITFEKNTMSAGEAAAAVVKQLEKEAARTPPAIAIQGELPLAGFLPPDNPVPVVADWGRQCFFPPYQVDGGWKITTATGWKFVVSDQSQLLPDGTRRTSKVVLGKSWSIRHATAFLALLQVTEGDRENGWFRFRIGELVARLWSNRNANSRSSITYYHDAGRRIKELMNFWVFFQRPDGREAEFRIVGEARVEKLGRARNSPKFVTMHFDPVFLAFQSEMLEIEQVPMRLDIISRISGDIPQAMYWFLMASAVHHGAKNPWAITVTNLLKKMGLKIPDGKAARKKIFSRSQKGKPSYFARLNDGLPNAKGDMILRVEWKETAADWILLIWSEPTTTTTALTAASQIQLIGEKSRGEQTAEEKEKWASGGKTKRFWLAGGGNTAAFAALLGDPERKMPVAQVEFAKSRAELAAVNFARVQKLTKMAVALTGDCSKVIALFSDLKVEVEIGGGPRNPPGALISRLLTLIKQNAAEESKKWRERGAR